MIKKERDVWQLSDLVNNGNDVVNQILQEHVSMRYLLGITIREAGIKWDEETQSLYVGITPDPVFLGYNQGQDLW